MSNSTRNRPSEEPSAKPARAATKTGKAKITTTPNTARAGKPAQRTAVASGSPVRTRRPAAKKRPATENVKARSAQRDLQPRIAEIAYLIAEREGFPAGRELEHWLQAEIEILELLESDLL